MISFKEYIVEASVKTVVAAFGRMSPPTVGHGLLVKKLVDEAKKRKADHVIYLSKTQDKAKNPLSVEQKVKWAKMMFPGVNIKAADEHLRTFIEMAAALNLGYKNIVLIAGSDRVEEYKMLMNKYNGSEFSFDSIEIVSAGERDPDADGAAGMSATKMRAAAASDNVVEFRKGLPAHMRSKARDMMAEIKAGMTK